MTVKNSTRPHQRGLSAWTARRGRERGQALGRATGASARKIYDLKVSMYEPREGMMTFWDEIASASKGYIEKYAPVTWEEMLGFGSAEGCDLDVL